MDIQKNQEEIVYAHSCSLQRLNIRKNLTFKTFWLYLGKLPIAINDLIIDKSLSWFYWLYKLLGHRHLISLYLQFSLNFLSINILIVSQVPCIRSLLHLFMRNALLRKQCLLLVDVTVDLFKLNFFLFPKFLYFSVVQKSICVLNNPITDFCLVNYPSSILPLYLSALLFL